MIVRVGRFAAMSRKSWAFCMIFSTETTSAISVPFRLCILRSNTTFIVSCSSGTPGSPCQFPPSGLQTSLSLEPGCEFSSAHLRRARVGPRSQFPPCQYRLWGSATRLACRYWLSLSLALPGSSFQIWAGVVRRSRTVTNFILHLSDGTILSCHPFVSNSIVSCFFRFLYSDGVEPVLCLKAFEKAVSESYPRLDAIRDSF